MSSQRYLEFIKDDFKNFEDSTIAADTTIEKLSKLKEHALFIEVTKDTYLFLFF